MANKEDSTPVSTRLRNNPSSNKRPRQDTVRKGSEKKKRIESSSIKTITNVDFDSSDEEEETMERQDELNDPDNATFKVKKTGSTSQGSMIAVNDLERILDRRFSVLATAKQVEGMADKIKKNEDDIADIRISLGRINDKLDSRPLSHHDRSSPHQPRLGHGREYSFNLSRRSLRIWPLSGSSDADLLESFQAFARSALLISDAEVKTMKIERIRRTRTPRNSTAYSEVCVTFESTEDRDFIASRAPNLAPLIEKQSGTPKAGIRMDVPGYLMPTFKDLNAYAYMVRQSSGKNAKTHVKFDDTEMSLFLEVRVNPSSNWLRVSPERARQLVSENASEDLKVLQRNLKRLPTNGSDRGILSIPSTSAAHNGQGATWSPPTTLGSNLIVTEKIGQESGVRRLIKHLIDLIDLRQQ